MYVPILKFIDVLVLEILDVKMYTSRTRCQATGVAMATILRLTRWGIILMLASKNEVYVTTRNGVMAHFTLIHHMPV